MEDGAVTDITVTYTATDTIYTSGATLEEVNKNTISIDLPAQWEPAYLPKVFL